MRFRQKYFQFILLFILFPLVGCVPEGVRLPQSEFLGSLERKSGLIAYIGNDGNIYTIDQGGGNQIAITNNASLRDAEADIIRFYDFPAWSSNSDRLAYVAIELNEERDSTTTIYTNSPEGEIQEDIFSSQELFPFYLYWAPNSERISFLTQSLLNGGLALHLASIQTGETSVIDTGQPYYFAWSPNGDRILAHVGGSYETNPGIARLTYLTIEPGVTERGLDLEPAFFLAPAFSPNGKYFLFAGSEGKGEQGLILTSIEGSVLSILDPTEERVAFGWASRGNNAAYIVNQDGILGIQGRLSVVNLDDPRNPIISVIAAERVIAFFWDPKGEQLAFFERIEIPEVSDSEDANELFVVKLSVADVESGESEEITTFLPPNNFLSILNLFDQYQRSATIWSPDGNNLVISAVAPSGESGIFVVHVSGNLDPRFLAEGMLAFWSFN